MAKGLELSKSQPQNTPPTTSEQYIKDYLDYSIDAAQVIPSLVLPAVGLVVALSRGLNQIGMALLLAVGIPMVCWIVLKIFNSDPVVYVGKGYIKGRYTFLSIAGLVMNIICAAVVIVFV
jgi:hypothetical protein